MTRWLDYLLNISPFTRFKICPMEKNISHIGFKILIEPSRDCPRYLNLAKLAKFRQVWSHWLRIVIAFLINFEFVGLRRRRLTVQFLAVISVANLSAVWRDRFQRLPRVKIHFLSFQQLVTKSRKRLIWVSKYLQLLSNVVWKWKANIFLPWVSHPTTTKKRKCDWKWAQNTIFCFYFKKTLV